MREYRGATHSNLIKKAYDLLEELWEDYMLNGKINPVSGIFLGRNNWNYQDKIDIVVTPNNPLGDSGDAATLADKYQGALPGDFVDKGKVGNNVYLWIGFALGAAATLIGLGLRGAWLNNRNK